jgi:hypothetical protein
MGHVGGTRRSIICGSKHAIEGQKGHGDRPSATSHPSEFDLPNHR